MSGKIIVFIFVGMVFIKTVLLATFWNRILPVDSWLLKQINSNWNNELLDTVLPFMRETLFWVPLYLFLLLMVLVNFGTKGLWWILASVLAAALADLISSQLIKESIMRLRPCQEPEIAGQIRFFINYCPQSSSFTSSHATSHFAQATFFFFTLRRTWKWAGLFFAWAFIIAYTQVYVGVHYPFDVFCGAVLGFGIGYSITKLFHNQIGLLSLDKQ